MTTTGSSSCVLTSKKEDVEKEEEEEDFDEDDEEEDFSDDEEEDDEKKDVDEKTKTCSAQSNVKIGYQYLLKCKNAMHPCAYAAPRKDKIPACTFVPSSTNRCSSCLNNIDPKASPTKN